MVLALLTRYVQMRAAKSSRKVSDLITALDKGDLAQSLVSQIIDEVKVVVLEVQEMLPPMEGDQQEAADFQNKAEVLEAALQSLGPRPSTLIRGVVVLILQTLIEKLRTETLTPEAVQKVEECVGMMREGLVGLELSGGMVEFLLDRSCDTAAERSLRS
mmetsp:Transcript_38266/g.59715  ORF Transcript_38266/g.59715 Transcript_38266/m.59715 type:complete len:159 (-) Transcript_38266:135-611(-)